MDDRPSFLMAAILATGALVVACSPSDLAKAFMGGGPNIAANTQLGKENHQTVGSVSNIDASGVDQLVVNNVSTLMITALVVAAVVGTLGWVLPTPSTMIKKWKDRG